MPLAKLEHYLVLTPDIDATRDFYVDVLGMQSGFRPPLGFPGHWVYIGDTPVIHIAEWTTYTARQKAKDAFVTTPAEGTGPVDHIAFGAEDYDGVLERIRKHGVPVRESNNPNNVVRQLFLFDPNHVQIEINFRK
jgi:catechol 2,3-dioxygenase-like lactoylglutathione lyase family enzyme